METYIVLDTVDTVLDRLLLALDHTNAALLFGGGSPFELSSSAIVIKSYAPSKTATGILPLLAMNNSCHVNI